MTASTTLGEGEINIGFGTAIDSLTPFRSNTARNAPYFLQLYETLAVLNDKQEIEPYIAKSWETTDDGYTYSVEIWDKVTDSEGHQITAADVVWFIQEAKTRALKPVFSKVESVEQTGDYTFQVKFASNMYGTFETILFDTYIISKEAFEASSDEFATTPVTTSPYKCTGFTASTSLSFDRRDDYWQDIENLPECVRPLQKKVNYQIITEASQMGIALETGVIDAAIDIASSTGAQFVGNDSYTMELSDGSQGWQMFFSGDDSSLVADNQELRQAICYGIDADGLIAGLASGYGTQMWDVASPRVIGFNEKWKEEDYFQYDLNKAKELLAESGYNGETLKILGTSSAFSSRLAQLLQNYLMAIGVNAEINSVDMALYTSIRLDGSQYDIVLGTVGGYSLADQWSIRFDPKAYPGGDATSRHDENLAELLYKTWAYDGWTEENINEVHNYIKDSAIAYGLVNPQVFTIWSNDINLVKDVKGGISGFLVPSACQLAEK
ncbi:MAG: ABC transporter substrate-binding protein [Anaerocolumna sp.]